jgi:thiol-disulfide isomerase/thioredoxin
MSSLVGKPIVLNMWSITCTVCMAETPAVESVARRVGDSVTFVGVDTFDEKAPALAFLHRYHVTYLQLSDPNEQVGSDYAIPGLPVTVFVSAHGKVVGEYLGALNKTTLAHYLKALFGVPLPS